MLRALLHSNNTEESSSGKLGTKENDDGVNRDGEGSANAGSAKPCVVCPRLVRHGQTVSSATRSLPGIRHAVFTHPMNDTCVHDKACDGNVAYNMNALVLNNNNNNTSADDDDDDDSHDSMVVADDRMDHPHTGSDPTCACVEPCVTGTREAVTHAPHIVDAAAVSRACARLCAAVTQWLHSEQLELLSWTWVLPHAHSRCRGGGLVGLFEACQKVCEAHTTPIRPPCTTILADTSCVTHDSAVSVEVCAVAAAVARAGEVLHVQSQSCWAAGFPGRRAQGRRVCVTGKMPTQPALTALPTNTPSLVPFVASSSSSCSLPVSAGFMRKWTWVMVAAMAGVVPTTWRLAHLTDVRNDYDEDEAVCDAASAVMTLLTNSSDASGLRHRVDLLAQFAYSYANCMAYLDVFHQRVTDVTRVLCHVTHPEDVRDVRAMWDVCAGSLTRQSSETKRCGDDGAATAAAVRGSLVFEVCVVSFIDSVARESGDEPLVALSVDCLREEPLDEDEEG